MRTSDTAAAGRGDLRSAERRGLETVTRQGVLPLIPTRKFCRAHSAPTAFFPSTSRSGLTRFLLGDRQIADVLFRDLLGRQPIQQSPVAIGDQPMPLVGIEHHVGVLVAMDDADIVASIVD